MDEDGIAKPRPFEGGLTRELKISMHGGAGFSPIAHQVGPCFILASVKTSLNAPAGYHILLIISSAVSYSTEMQSSAPIWRSYALL
jgi:hypothetical protein